MKLAASKKQKNNAGTYALEPLVQTSAARCLAIAGFAAQRKLNPRRAGGGVFRHPPLRFFADSEKTAARSAAGFSPTCWYIDSANFEQKKYFKSSQVRSPDQVK